MKSQTPRFQNEVAECPRLALSIPCHRVVDLEAYQQSPDPRLLFDLGPKISGAGQRFSPPMNHRGLYVATDPSTAGAEFAGSLEDWQAGNCPHRAVFSMSVRLEQVLDLTCSRIRRILKTTPQELQSAWLGFSELNAGSYPPTWLLGQAAFESGRFDAIRFRSTKNKAGDCLLIFTERLVAGRTHVKILRSDGSTWETLPP